MGAWGRIRGRRLAGYDVVRVVLAAVLLVAAALKGHQLATEPVLGQSLLESRWVLIGVVEFELLLGLWLVAGIYAVFTWHVAAVCFVVFAGVSLFKGLSGDPSCGCFGRLPVSPWLTLVLDLGVVAILLGCQPRRAEGLRLGAGAQARPLAKFLAVWAVAGIAAFLALVRSSETMATELGDALASGHGVALRPERWVGKRLPLLRSIEVDARLDQGSWLIVVYNFDSPGAETLWRSTARGRRRCGQAPRESAWR